MFDGIDCHKCTHFDKCVRECRSNCSGYEPKETEQTNYEWIHTLNTEQLAEWLAKHFICDGCDCDKQKQICGGSYYGCRMAFEKWLKEVHKE